MSEHESPCLASMDGTSWPAVDRDLETDFVVVGAGIMSGSS
jgi:hypothetical protein